MVWLRVRLNDDGTTRTSRFISATTQWIFIAGFLPFCFYFDLPATASHSCSDVYVVPVTGPARPTQFRDI
jgi:hypothetical protein